MKKNLALSTLYQILCIITPLLTTPYISRVLGPEGVGVYSYTNSIQMYFSMFAALGTVTYGAREIARNRNDQETYSRLFWEIELMTVITSLICLAVWFVWCYFSEAYQIYYLILTIALLATMVDISWFYTGMEQLQCIVLQNSLFKVLGVVAVFLFVKTRDDTGIYIAIMALTTFLGNFSMWIYLPKYIRKVKVGELRIGCHFHETLIYFVPTIATSVYTVLDKTLIGAITKSESENGFYEQATKIINMAKAVTFAGVNSVLGARISWLFAEKKHDEIRTRINWSMDYILFMGIGICFGLLAVADQFVMVFFGEGYEKTTYLLKLMSPLVVIIGISNCLGAQYYNPAGLRSLSAKFIIAGSGVNLILNLLFIPKLQSLGAVIATLVAECIISFLYLRNCRGYVKAAELLQKTWKKLTAGAVMLIGVQLLGRCIAHGILSVAIQVIAGVAIYVLLLFCMRDSFIVDVVLPQFRKARKA